MSHNTPKTDKFVEDVIADPDSIIGRLVNHARRMEEDSIRLEYIPHSVAVILWLRASNIPPLKHDFNAQDLRIWIDEAMEVEKKDPSMIAHHLQKVEEYGQDPRSLVNAIGQSAELVLKGEKREAAAVLQDVVEALYKTA